MLNGLPHLSHMTSYRGMSVIPTNPICLIILSPIVNSYRFYTLNI